MKIEDHRLTFAEQMNSTNADQREEGEISLIVVHNISLPAGHFGTTYVCELFCNELDLNAHHDFSGLEAARVSSHLFIRRDATVVQFVPFDQRAWHAGDSSFNGRSACNDYSIGIELEGTDTSGYQEGQYRILAEICHSLIASYDIPAGHITGHSDIAPGRKTDPGSSFDWNKFRNLLARV